jgi:urease accessory protein
LAANIVSAGIRLIPLGQTDGQKVTAALEPAVAEIAAEADTAGLDDLGGCVLLADIASMRHETQYTRLFRT